MKEASGEANMTVVTIILISVVVAVVTPIITSMMGNTAKRTCCMDAGGYYKGGACYDGDNNAIDTTDCVNAANERNKTTN